METATTMNQIEGWQERLAEDEQGVALRELRDYLAVKQAELRRLLDAEARQEEYALNQKFWRPWKRRTSRPWPFGKSITR